MPTPDAEKEEKLEEGEKDLDPILDPNYYPPIPIYVPSYEEDARALDDNLVLPPEPAPEEEKNKQVETKDKTQKRY